MKRCHNLQVSGQITLGVALCLASVTAHSQAPTSSQSQGTIPAPFTSAKLGSPAGSFVPNVPNQERVLYFRNIETFKMAGLTHDRSQIPNMIEPLKTDVQGATTETITLALARMGAAEALPAIDDLLTHGYTVGTSAVQLSPEEACFVRAARARLLAETESTPHAKAMRFFQEVGETPQQINVALQKYNQEATHPSVLPQHPWKEGFAEEELADMIYHGPAAELLSDPLVAQIDFSQLPSADYKFKLALLTPDQQRQKLVDWLINFDDENTVGQLLIDLGRPEAIKAITAKLEDLDKNSAAYNPYSYGRLLIVLYVSGDHHQSPIWSHLAHPAGVGGIGPEKNHLKFGY